MVLQFIICITGLVDYLLVISAPSLFFFLAIALFVVFELILFHGFENSVFQLQSCQSSCICWYLSQFEHHMTGLYLYSNIVNIGFHACLQDFQTIHFRYEQFVGFIHGQDGHGVQWLNLYCLFYFMFQQATNMACKPPCKATHK